MIVGLDGKIRCFGGQKGKELLGKYHDEEWGIPIHQENKLFEMIILEGAQAGLNWETILKRRDSYKKAFHFFDPKKVSSMNDEELESLYNNSEIIRNKLKIYSVRKNAKVFLNIQNEFGSFDDYLWKYVKGQPIVNNWKSIKDIPSKSTESDLLSLDLKKRGMSFVGSKIMYAFMQAVGMVNDHIDECWLPKK